MIVADGRLSLRGNCRPAICSRLKPVRTGAQHEACFAWVLRDRLERPRVVQALHEKSGLEAYRFSVCLGYVYVPSNRNCFSPSTIQEGAL